jgi:basic membrane protein A
MRHSRNFKLLLVPLLAAVVLLSYSSVSVQANGLTDPDQPHDRVPDAPWVLLAEEDLPGFHAVDETAIVGPLALAKRLTSALAGPEAVVTNVTQFRSDDPFGSALVFSFIAYPLSEDEIAIFDALAGDPDAFLGALAEIASSSGATAEPAMISELGVIGNASIGFSFPLGDAPVASEVDSVWTRRNEILQVTWAVYPTAADPPVDLLEVGQLVDSRVADKFTGTIFRAPSEFVPYLAIHLPTPLDVSTDPAVIGANLLLAALMMLPFAAAVELFTRLISEQESSLASRLRSSRWFSRRGPARKDYTSRGFVRWARVVIIMLFYGATFSLLDPAWRPFTPTGLVLLFNMTLAYGIVGIAADFLQYRALRKWGTPASLTLRPTNLFLAVASTAVSRLLTLVPGMMFGTPQALVVDEDNLDEVKRRKLVKITALTMLSIGLGLWALTSITTLLQRGVLNAGPGNFVGAFEALLLIIFAVTLENTFIAMLGFPGSLGEYIRKNSYVLWLVGMVGITFVFCHTLLNPRGDLAGAIEDTSVLLLLTVAGVFVVLTFVWALVARRKGKADRIEDKDGGARRGKRARTAAPAWVWIAMAAVAIMVGGTLWLEQLPGLPTRSVADDTAEGEAVESATSAPVHPAETSLIDPVFDLAAASGRLCYVPSGVMSESPLDLAAWRGLQLVASQYGMLPTLADPASFDEEGYYQALIDLVDVDCDLITGLGYLGAPFSDAAADFPDQTFLLLGSSRNGAEPGNLWEVAYDLDQGAYLAGYLAAASGSGDVGTFGIETVDIQAAVECFAQGAADFNQAHTASVSILGWDSLAGEGFLAADFFSPETGVELAAQLIEAGADVLLPLAGVGPHMTGGGAVEILIAAGDVAVIGTSVDWSWALPELADQVLTSVEIRFERSLALAVGALGAEGWRHQGTLASGEVGFSSWGTGATLPAAAVEELAALINSEDPICVITTTDDAEAWSLASPQATSAPTATATPTPTATATATPSPTATLNPAQKISLYNLQEFGITQIEYPANQPFYVEHGFIFPIGYVESDYQAFYLEIDGETIPATRLTVYPMGSDEIVHFTLFSFPEGMEGSHTFVARWRVPGEPDTVETVLLVFVP